MLDSAVRQLQYGLALLRGRPISTRDLAAMVREAVANRNELGWSTDNRALEAFQGSTDEDVRATMNRRRWDQMVAMAVESTPYYRRRFQRLGLDPDLPFADRHQLPPTTKDAVRGLPEVFVSDRAHPTFQAWTTGTTGRPTSFWFSTYEIDLAAGLSALAFIQNVGLGPSDVVQVCISSRATLGIQNTMRACQMIGAGAFLSGFVHPGENLERLMTPVHLPGKKPRPSILTTTSSYLAALLAEAERRNVGPRQLGLETILCGGEVLTDALRLRAERVLGARVMDSYAMTETFPLAGMDCSQRHLHIAEEQGLVEVLTPDLTRVAQPGEIGTLVVTPYHPYRETTLVLRLATGDLVRVLDTDKLTCEYAGITATSLLLGRAMTNESGPELYQRDVLELLEGEVRVPLPATYAVTAKDDGYLLDILADPASGVGRALLDTALERGLPVIDVRVHDDPDGMPQPVFHRSLLRETTVTREGEDGTWALI